MCEGYWIWQDTIIVYYTRRIHTCMFTQTSCHTKAMSPVPGDGQSDGQEVGPAVCEVCSEEEVMRDGGQFILSRVSSFCSCGAKYEVDP